MAQNLRLLESFLANRWQVSLMEANKSTIIGACKLLTPIIGQAAMQETMDAAFDLKGISRWTKTKSAQLLAVGN